MARGSATKVARWRRCKKKAFYTDIKGLVPVVKSLAPSRGIYIHASLKEHYTGLDWTKPLQDLKLDLDKVFDEEREEWADLPQQLYRILRGYIAAYKTADKGIKTKFVEVPVQIQLNKQHTYYGIIDWIYEDHDGIWVADHKTVKAFPDEMEMYLDLQTVMYYKLITAKDSKIRMDDVKGVVFNFLRTKAPREPALLKSGGVSKAAIDTDITTYFETIRKNGLDPKDYEDMIPKLQGNVFYKRFRLPILPKTVDIMTKEIITTLDDVDYLTAIADFAGEPDKVAHMFPRNFMKQRCTWDCEFCRLCKAELQGQDTDPIIDEFYEKTIARKEEVEDGE